eukprot:gene15459-biopygen3239
MPTLMLEEVAAVKGSHPGATPETRPMTSAGILDEYHIAEEKLAQARGEEWERQRQRVADKVRGKRQGKAGGDAPCNAAVQSTPSVTRVTLAPASSADADSSSLRTPRGSRGRQRLLRESPWKVYPDPSAAVPNGPTSPTVPNVLHVPNVQGRQIGGVPWFPYSLIDRLPKHAPSPSSRAFL